MIERVFESGTDPNRLSMIMSSPASQMHVETFDTQQMSFDCDVVKAKRLAFINAKYDGKIKMRRQTPGDKLLLFFPQRGSATIKCVDRDWLSVPGRGTIIDSYEQRGFDVFQPRDHLVVALDRGDLQGRLSTLLDISVRHKFAFQPDVDLNCGPGLVLHHLANLMYEGLSKGFLQHEMPLTNLSDAFFNCVLLSLPHAMSDLLNSGISTATPRHVKRAVDYMHAHISEALTLENIVVASGVSARTLQNGFHLFKGTTPLSYLRDLRLIAVNRDLLSNPKAQTVSKVAHMWGFVHMGRFSADYFVRFGERPSETLRRRK